MAREVFVFSLRISAMEVQMSGMESVVDSLFRTLACKIIGEVREVREEQVRVIEGDDSRRMSDRVAGLGGEA